MIGLLRNVSVPVTFMRGELCGLDDPRISKSFTCVDSFAHW